jgi:SAM-dependent methyltransferase
VLLLAITNELTLDVAPVPLLWVVPLAIYLSTFIVCFEREGWYRRRWWLRAMAIAVVAMAVAGAADPRLGLPLEVTIYAAGLFICCTVCHGELAASKPPPERLTSFYLSIAAGGAAGACFVAVVAPRIFPDLLELPIGLTGTALASLFAASLGAADRRLAGRTAAVLAAVVGLALYVQVLRLERDYLVLARNFYGTVKLRESRSGPAGRRLELIHGSIIHGVQLLGDDRHRTGTAYYGAETGIGIALREWKSDRPRRIGVVGLGAGTLAVYAKPDDRIRFYEVNPLVAEIARRDFSFLADCRAPVDLLVGDARLVLERQPDQRFDVLVIDAFSSDSVPTHLLTLQAFELYFRHLAPDGVLAFHVSNRYLDLAALVWAAARATGREWIWVRTPERPRDAVFAADWAFVTSAGDFLALPDLRERMVEPPAARTRVAPWTDSSSSLASILR